MAIFYSRDWTRVSCIGRWILYCWTREAFVSKLPYNKLDPLIMWSCLPHFFGLLMPSQFGGYFCSFHLPKRFRFQNSKDIISKMLISSSLGAARTFSDILSSEVSKFPIPKYTGHNFWARRLWYTSGSVSIISYHINHSTDLEREWGCFYSLYQYYSLWSLLLLSCFSRVRLCVTP